MQYLLNRSQIRAYDRLATEMFKIPGLILMENAGRGAADIIADLLPQKAGQKPKVVVACGTGNNGGDGFVVARYLSAMAEVQVLLAGEVESITGDALVNFEILQRMQIPWMAIADSVSMLAEADFIIDALLGTGLNRPIEGVAAAFIEQINQSSATVIALDIPSGLDADTGVILGYAVQAKHTITFAHAKPGIFTPQGKIQSGTLHRATLGIPDAKILSETGFAARLIRAEDIAPLITRRNAATYKHKAGDVLVIAGSPGKTGAAKLTAESALRTGAGLVTIATWPDSISAFEKEIKEIMLAPLVASQMPASLAAAMAKRGSIAIGPGFGIDGDATEIVRLVLNTAEVPVIVDADALTICARNPALLKTSRAAKILTPHSGELARLLGCTSAEIEGDRFQAARRAAADNNAIVVLKGAHTIVSAPAGETWVSMTANPALATAGSGDVLAGIIAAFATSLPALQAAIAGVFVHASAADLWSDMTLSDRGMLAGDIAQLIPRALGILIDAKQR